MTRTKIASLGTLAAALRRSGGRLVNAALAPTGLHLVRRTPPATLVSPLDLRKVTDDPIEGAYHAEGRRFIAEVSLRHCWTLGTLGFVCSLDAGHPQVETLLAYERNRCSCYADSPLRSFYAAWQPANVAEAFGLEPMEASQELRDTPHIGYVFPWESVDPITAMASRVTVKEQNIKLPNGKRWSIHDGIQQAGPVSEARGELEFVRLTRVYDSIRQHGYRRSDLPDGDVQGQALAADGTVRFRISGGHHRAAALVVLGYERVAVRLHPQVIRRGDVDSWPNVRSRLFTRQQAQAIFDRLLDGTQPANYSHAWAPRSSCNPIGRHAERSVNDCDSVSARQRSM